MPGADPAVRADRRGARRPARGRSRHRGGAHRGAERRSRWRTGGRSPPHPPPTSAWLPLAGDPADPAVLGAAVHDHLTGPYPVMRSGQLLLLPGGEFVRTRMRAIQSRLSDPVSFALLDGDAHGVASPTSRGGRSTTSRAGPSPSMRRACAPSPATSGSCSPRRGRRCCTTASRRASRARAHRRRRDRAAARRRGRRGAPRCRAPAVLAALREQVLALPAYASARHLIDDRGPARDHLELARVGERERLVERRALGHQPLQGGVDVVRGHRPARLGERHRDGRTRRRGRRAPAGRRRSGS